MSGNHTGPDRFLRKAVLSGNLSKEQTAEGSAADTTTITSYALAGLFATIQFVPGTTQTAQATVPAANAAANNKGWRDDVAEDASNQILWDAVNWTVRLRLKSSAAQSTQTTVIVYRISGGVSTEMGRVAVTTALTTVTATVNHVVPIATGLTFAAGDLVQVEVYTTTLLLGVATPPTTATTITCTIEESDVNGGSKTTPGTYIKQFVTSKAGAATLTGVAARAIAANRTGVAALSPATGVTKGVTLGTKVAALAFLTARTKNVGLAAKVAALALGTAMQRNVGIFRAAAVAFATAIQKKVGIFRTAAITLGVVFARAVTLYRSFATSVTIAAVGAVQITMVILNRIVSGGGTVVKKIIAIFDD